jgi:DNA gyrase subunit A
MRLYELTEKYGDTRRTELCQMADTTKEEKEIEFVEPEKCVVIMSESGMIKRVPSSTFKVQKRNGKGVKTQDDITNAIIKTNTVDSLMIFTNKGKMYRLLVNDIPEGNNTAKGVNVSTLVEMEAGESPSTIYSIYRDTEAKYVLFVTKNGIVKKTALEEYIKTKKKNGIAAITLKEGDELAAVTLVKEEPIIIVTKQGMCIKFSSTDIGMTSRSTMGVKGITLCEGDNVAAAQAIFNEKDQLAIFTSGGLGKKFALEEIPLQKRAGKGLICYKATDTSGEIASIALVSNEDNILVMGAKNSICVSATEIPSLGRIAAGNQIIKNETIKMVSKI